MTLRGADGELAAIRHRVARVDGEVHDHLFELDEVGLHRPEIAPVHDSNVDLLADQAPQQHRQVGQRFAEIEHLRPQRLAARERQQLPHQAGGPVGVLFDLHDVGKRRVARPVRVEQEIGRHMMADNTLLKSCARPPASWPTVSIFCDCANWFSSCAVR